MNLDIFILACVCTINSAAIFFQVRTTRLLRTQFEEYKKVRTKLYEELADPDKILEEMEKGARLREMHDASRTTLPRDDATGQHARVFRPKMRGKLPSNQWNPQYPPSP